MGFDHNDKKKCALPHARHIYYLENYFYWRAMSLRAWRVLTLADENYRGEPYETLIKCLFISQFMNCFIAARGKSKIETTGVSVK